MNTSYGWIKLHRNLLRHPLWEVSTPEQKVLLMALLMMANHAEKKWEWNGRPYYCRPGQMITSLKSLSEKCGNGVTRRKVQTALRFFGQTGVTAQYPYNYLQLGGSSSCPRKICYRW